MKYHSVWNFHGKYISVKTYNTSCAIQYLTKCFKQGFKSYSKSDTYSSYGKDQNFMTKIQPRGLNSMYNDTAQDTVDKHTGLCTDILYGCMQVS